MSEQQPLYGQSNYDICNQVYGTLDNFVKLLIDSKLKSSSDYADKKYSFDPALKNINNNFIGFPYATDLSQNTADYLSGVYSGAYGGAYG